uniref:Endo/exonuclease/phosphatase domain-containing protein n=1 Tax=Angiostrongylus cantonensis TaxID=6313 RepID=A0A0K0D3Q9_ANGCA
LNCFSEHSIIEEPVAPTFFSTRAPTLNYDEEEVEVYMDLERFYREGHTFFKVITGDFNAKIGPRRSSEERHIGTNGLEWNEQGGLPTQWSEFFTESLEERYGAQRVSKATRSYWATIGRDKKSERFTDDSTIKGTIGDA